MSKAERRFKRRLEERRAQETVRKQVVLDWLRTVDPTGQIVAAFQIDFDFGDGEEVTSVQQRLLVNHEGLVSHAHGATARAAAKLITPKSGTLRYRVLELIAQSGFRGLTRDEIAQKGGMSPNTVRPRVRELFEGDFITHRLDDSGEVVTRKSALGRDSEVLEVTRKGHAAL